jgi:hypothetical protein
MANHGYTTTKKHMTIEKIDADLREFSARHFGDIAEIEGPFDIQDELAGWLVKFNGCEYSTFQVWLHTRQKLEFRHPMGFWVGYWGQSLFQHEMGEKYEGRISDDGYEGFSKPDTEKISTFTKYITLMVSMVPSEMGRRAARGLYTVHLDKEFKLMPSF